MAKRSAENLDPDLPSFRWLNFNFLYHEWFSWKSADSSCLYHENMKKESDKEKKKQRIQVIKDQETKESAMMTSI